MILDHEWMAAAAGLVEHSPGIVSSVIGIVLYALLRDGLPAFNAYRRRRNGGHNPGNPGNSGIGDRLLACEDGISEVKQSCTRTETLWEGQKEFNKRMEKHVEKIHARIDGLAGLGK